MKLRRRVGRAWEVFQETGRPSPWDPPAPRRKPVLPEWLFVAMICTAAALWIMSTPVGLAGSYPTGTTLFGYGLTLVLLSVVPLVWALVVRRGRVVPMVRWTLLAVLLLGVLPAVAAAALS